MLGMKLAEKEILQEESGKTPVLLLDDVFSELDGKRQNLLLESIEGLQVFITCTEDYISENRLKIPSKRPICKFLISGGKVVI